MAKWRWAMFWVAIFAPVAAAADPLEHFPDGSLGRTTEFRGAGKQVETYFPESGEHGFYVGRPEGPEWKEATRRSVAFLKERFEQRAAAQASATTNVKPPALDQYGSLDWVDPDKIEPSGTRYRTFRSQTIQADVSYLVYLPPDYDKEKDKRYPVLYALHASGGTPKRAAAGVVAPLDPAIRAGRAAPMIIIFPNGLRGATMYCDSRDGKYPVETVIIKDLIPHVDATYRTVPAREGRALDGFSMGGFGAAHFGFKYPEVFGVVSIQAPPLLGPELQAPLPARAWSRLFPAAMGSDLEYFRANDPFSLIPKNAAALRDRSVIRIIAHAEDENWLVPRCEELHQLLLQHGIAHHWLCLTNVKSHSPNQVMNTLGDAGWMFFGSSFAYLQTQSRTKPPGSPASNVGAKVKTNDAAAGTTTKTEPKVDTSQLIPLTDLGTKAYQGFPGGLYPDGKNERPAPHEAAGLALARQVQPLDANGRPSAAGKVVLLGIGFSNTVQVFNGFMQAARGDQDVNSQVVLVNGAMGGMSAHMVQDPDDRGRGTMYWSRVDEQLKAAGVTRAQVQAVWIKETNPAPHAGGFPQYIRDLQSELTRIVQVIHQRFPNAKLAYLSSRTYGGWAKAPPERKGGPGNSEPYSYETGFAVKWLIEKQLQGDLALNYDPQRGAVRAPWLSWGPYLWANGEVPRQDGFHFQPSDFRENDRMHHSLQGQAKTGRQLLRFFKTDPTTRGWFVQNSQRGEAPATPAFRSLEGSKEEPFPDGSVGRMSEFRGADGSFLPAYVRKPKGEGPFPVVVMLHGGGSSKGATYGFKKQTPAPAFVAEGWAIISIDFRPTNVPLTVPAGAVVFPALPPIEWNDTVAAIAAVRTLPYIDGRRVAVIGGSHGGYVMARVASRTDLSCAILCAPAIFDLIELSRAIEQKADMVQVIKNKVAEGEQKYGAPMAVIARHPAAYGYESPLTEAAKVRCPILIINGRNDRASPLNVVQAYVDKLRALGKEAEIYSPDNGPHGFYFGIPKPIPETEEAAQRAVAFIRKHFTPR